jgi:transforming growth factor-beta-induced protein
MSSCEEDEPELVDIVDTAIADGRFASLAEALTEAGLVTTLKGGEYTVFAPTDEAFQSFLDANGFATIQDIPVDVLTQVLLNHVVGGTVRSTDLTDGYVPTLAEESTTNNNVSMLIDLTNGVVLNGSTNVTQPDVEASNGVIHVVDEVIAVPTVVDLALDNSLFETLVAALTRSDLTADFVGILSGAGPFTVFAPTNQAFQDLLDSNDSWNELADIDVATLEAVLSYHVVDGANVLSNTLSDGQVVTTFGGSTFEISVGGEVTITDGQGGTATVGPVDVQGGNGVVHVIDAVIIP